MTPNTSRWSKSNFDGLLVGVAAWEVEDLGEPLRGYPALMLHELYVRPKWQRRGVGTPLLAAAAKGQSGFRLSRRTRLVPGDPLAQYTEG